ncbi:MAG: ribonuclease HI family protein [Planctomycetes bacterium]|nr:ribonuclease HI family protein [Planctomycetota bacterium]
MSEPEPAAANPCGAPAHRAHAAAHLVLYVDGACSGNPGPCGSAAILKTDDGATILEKARAFGPGTNNEAEYQAVILGLELAAELRPQRLTIRSDSELMVRQLAGQYRVKARNLKPLLVQARRGLEPFESVEIEFIPRSQNLEADKLARKAVEKARQVDAALPPEARKKPQQKTFKLK